MCCYMLRQALRSLSMVVPRLWQQEAGLPDRVELEEIAKEDDDGDPTEWAMRVVSVQSQSAVYRCYRQTAHLANLIHNQHSLVLPT